MPKDRSMVPCTYFSQGSDSGKFRIPNLNLKKPEFLKSHSKDAKVSLFLEGVVTTPAKYSNPIVTPDKYATAPLKTDIYENMYNKSGGGVNTTQTTEGKATVRNSVVDTFMGFLSDGEMGDKSKFVINNKTSNLRKEFFQELDTDKKGTVSKDEYMKRMEDLQKRQEKLEGSEYYGKGVKQYSKEKAEASFNAIANGDDEITEGDINNFFSKTMKTGETYTRKENGKDITYNDVSQIDYANLPEDIKSKTKTQSDPKLVEKGTTTPGKLVQEESEKIVDQGHVTLYEHTYNSKNKESKDIKTNDNAIKLLDTFNNYNIETNKDKMPLKDVLARMKDNGVSEEETLKMLKEGGIDTNIPNLEIRIKDQGKKHAQLEKFETKNNLDILPEENHANTQITKKRELENPGNT